MSPNDAEKILYKIMMSGSPKSKKYLSLVLSDLLEASGKISSVVTSYSTSKNTEKSMKNIHEFLKGIEDESDI